MNEYDNCIGIKEETSDNNLIDFLDIDESEKEKILDDRKEWEKHWIDMPEFVQEDNPSYKKLIVSFRNKEDYEKFASLIEQKLTEKTKSIWYPQLDREENSLLRWIEND